MNINRIFLIGITVVIFSCIALIVDFQLIENIVIPDICAYHSGESTTKLFDLFYDFPASGGGHPSPTAFHFIFTTFIGGITGYFISKRIFKNF